jgi:X-Pro dipeptidyl-peptidase (S15 family)
LRRPLRALRTDPPSIVVTDGVTQPVLSYADAIRERVWIPVPGIDQNADGITDRVAVDIIRPAETNAGLKAPAIIDTSPYYGPATVVTGPVGSHTYTVTATDNAGNTNSLTHTYNVYWASFAWGATPKATRARS